MTTTAPSGDTAPGQAVAYDIAAFRAQFPALRHGTAHFDGPGGTQTPEPVARAIADTLTGPLANRGRMTAAERRADDIVREARASMADLIGADPGGIVFGRSMTALTFDLARTLAADWGPGDEVVVTRLDHDANVRPWVIAAERAGATVRWAPFDPATGELDPDDVAGLLTERTRLVAVTASSNLLGTRPDVRAISDAAHAVGAVCFVDGVHFSAHCPVDVADLGADVYACSPYKFFGPHCGVLAADPAWWADRHPDKLAPSSDAVPERFELGTLPYELLAGTTAAVQVIADLAGSVADGSVGDGGTRRERVLAGMRAIEAHEHPLHQRLERELDEIPGLVRRSRARRRTPTTLLTFETRSAQEAYAFLAERGINAPAGSFYALEASRWLGLGDTGGLRVGLAPYSDDDDVDRLITGLRAFVTG